jgi:PaREP1/PaREP8 domain containing family protein
VEEIVKRSRERGIDVEDVLIAALAKQDPQESVKLRISLAERYMAECEKYLKEGDPVQASEKAYKAAEEVVKALAEKFGVPELQTALKEGRWYAYLLGKASNTLARMLGGWIADGWSNAYFLHVWGFHEAKLAVEDMTYYVNRVREMLNEAKKVLAT